MLSKGPYDPLKSEPEILKFWRKGKFNKPEYHAQKGLQKGSETDDRESFCIICPPPNANARPHLGNLSGYSYQDLMGRFHRMRGKKTLLLPGKDHAGIQSEVVFERDVLQKEGKTKFNLGREKFYEAIYEFCTNQAHIARADEERVGLSADFDRDIFTMDPAIVDTILGTFIELYKKGQVYKGIRITNWCPKCQTALADIDTERKTRESSLWYIRYPIKETGGEITIATTRPETMLADTAVAVNPKDKRYKHLVGKTVILPLLDREIPIITDPKVEKEFGTGALKVTPAHAPEDYDIMLRWNEANPDKKIDYINIIWKDLKLYGPVGKYKGMKFNQARNEVLNDLKEKRLLIKEEKIEQNASVCERCKSIIEPIMSSQWYVEMETLAKDGKKAVKNGSIKIHPRFMEKRYFQWLDNIRDWPISRSLWWGYRIPVWYKGKKEEYIDDNGKVIEMIDGKPLGENKEEMMYVGINPPSNNIFLVPGKHGYALRKLFPALKKMGDNITILSDIKNLDKPTYLNYRETIKKYDLNNAIVVTHSLGAQAMLEYLVETGIKLRELIMLAPSTLQSPRIDQYIKLGFWKHKQKYSELKKQVGKITIVHSDNDPSHSAEASEEFANLFGNATRILEKGKDHYAGPNFDNHSEALTRLVEELSKTATWYQDEDVFDTWFSSGQWPYATLMKEGLMDYFYPTNVMETMYDILEWWVSRMIMLGIFKTGKIPFKNVYLHGMLLAPDGQKMSKSKGNVVHMDDIVNQYGADTLRLFYYIAGKAGSSYRLDWERIKFNRNFLNKIWNASKFVMMNLKTKNIEELRARDLKLKKADKDMIWHISNVAKEVTSHIESFKFNLALEKLQDSFWHVFCDKYLEESKQILYSDKKDSSATQWTLWKSLKTYVELMHPFVPFITESVWQELPKGKEEPVTIMYANWPEEINV